MSKKKKKIFEKKENSMIDMKKKFTAGSVYTTVAVIAVLCFAAGFLISGNTSQTQGSVLMSGSGEQKASLNPSDTVLPVAQQKAPDTMLYYIVSSSGCNTCEPLKPLATEIASKIGAEVKVIEYTKPMSIPGYVLVYDNKLTINGVNDRYSFEQTVCDVTGNKELCDMAAKNKPAEPEAPPVPEVQGEISVSGRAVKDTENAEVVIVE